MIDVSKLPPETLEIMKCAGFDLDEPFWDITSEEAFAEGYAAFMGRGPELSPLLDSLRAADVSKIGPKGQDQGDLKIAIAHNEGNVIMDFFGRQVTWIGVPPQTARMLASNLAKHADAVEAEAQ